MIRKTKIICTLGPASDTYDIIKKLVQLGMDAARFNFSHGTHESHLRQLTILKRVRDELGVPVAAILDTKGPEIRIKTFKDGRIMLAHGDTFTLTPREVEGTQSEVSVTYGKLAEKLEPGMKVLIDDGLIELAVDRIKGEDVICTVVTGGELSSNKSINIPDVAIPLPALTDRDRADLRFAAEQDFDFVAASFIRKASDIAEIREELAKWGGESIRIIAKIENREGVNNLDEIIPAADAIMVARGDLGVEVSACEVPVLQKEMVRKATLNGKPAIIATQMLDSMIRNPRPTRAEVSDVATAIFDGASCVMLSGETASGKYPLEALKMLSDTAIETEKAIDFWKDFHETKSVAATSIPDAITHTCCSTAMDLNAAAIVAATYEGRTARMISRFRPACPIVALTVTEKVRRQLAISWGVEAFLSGSVDSTDRMFSLCAECALKEGIVERGDTVVITAGVPLGSSGGTNLIKAQVIE